MIFIVKQLMAWLKFSAPAKTFPLFRTTCIIVISSSSPPRTNIWNKKSQILYRPRLSPYQIRGWIHFLYLPLQSFDFIILNQFEPGRSFLDWTFFLPWVLSSCIMKLLLIYFPQKHQSWLFDWTSLSTPCYFSNSPISSFYRIAITSVYWFRYKCICGW